MQNVGYETLWTVVGTATNGTATATKAAVTGRGQRHYITFVLVSFSAAPATALTCLVRNSASTTIAQFEISANATAPIMINFVKPLRGGEELSVDATVGAAGSGVIGTITLGGYTAGA